MQSKFVRAFVLTLAVAGFGAATHIATAKASASVTTSAVDGTVPLCLPNDPNACGID